MNNSRPNEHPPSITLGDIYFVVFRHKWVILALTAAGLVAAGFFYFTRQPPYSSEAKLFIRYISDSRAQNPTENNVRVTSTIELGQAVLNSEMEILTSFDLAKQVATNIGPEKILAKLGGGNDGIRAAAVIIQNLNAESKAGSVILLSFKHPDPALVQPVLGELINVYLDKHMQVHKSVGLSDDVLNEETTQLRLQIAQTEDEVRMAKTNAGIIDITTAEKSDSDEMARIRRELFQAETDMAERQATFTRLTENQPVELRSAPAATNDLPPDALARYKTACSHLFFLQKREDDYLQQQGYTEENKLVKEVRDQMVAATKTKADLEKKYPGLTTVEITAPAPVAPPTGVAAETKPLTSFPARVRMLQDQLARIQADSAKLDAAEAKIADLQRKKQIQEKNYQSFANSLEQARIDETLGPGRVSGINTIQTPTPPFKDFGKFYKKILMMVFGGLFAGLGWAFLMEFYLDRSVRRPVEIQTKLKIPFFLSIPDLGQNGHARLAGPARRQLEFKNGAPAEPGDAPLQVTSWQVNPALRTYYDALRDRLMVYFESINLTRKPKLVAVTGTNRGSGVSTIAAGLATSLSEIGDGRVLLVDMNLEHGAAQQFFRGKPGCKLDDALESEKRDSALVQENLYVVTEGSHSDKLPRVLPKRFAALVPKLKASDYDYIIFDMPPVSQTSVTARLAGFMDTVLLVIESEKSDREVVQQANALLQQSKAHVTAVLNKTRKYIPSRLQADFNSES